MRAPQFDGVLENVSQDAVYDAAAGSAADAVLGGMNATVFCYGQVRRISNMRTCMHVLAWHAAHAAGQRPAVRSCHARACARVRSQPPQLPASQHPLPRRRARRQTGAGKTFTMCGDARNYHHRGVIPRALHHIFREIDTRPDRIYR